MTRAEWIILVAVSVSPSLPAFVLYARSAPHPPAQAASERTEDSQWHMRCGCDSKGGYCIHVNRETREISFQDLTADACVDGRLKSNTGTEPRR